MSRRYPLTRGALDALVNVLLDALVDVLACEEASGFSNAEAAGLDEEETARWESQVAAALNWARDERARRRPATPANEPKRRASAEQGDT